jgi:hypothetical protein
VLSGGNITNNANTLTFDSKGALYAPVDGTLGCRIEIDNASAFDWAANPDLISVFWACRRDSHVGITNSGAGTILGCNRETGEPGWHVGFTNLPAGRLNNAFTTVTNTSISGTADGSVPNETPGKWFNINYVRNGAGLNHSWRINRADANACAVAGCASTTSYGSGPALTQKQVGCDRSVTASFIQNWIGYISYLMVFGRNLLPFERLKVENFIHFEMLHRGVSIIDN